MDAREQQIAEHLGLVHHVASRFRSAADYEDLVQVGTVGLIRAVDNFDAGLGNSFSSYAVPSIAGAIRHYLRDQSTSVKVPGRLQESSARVARAVDRLTQSLGHSPTIAEIARELGSSQDYVLEAIEANHAHVSLSLDSEDSSLGELGSLDEDLEQVETRMAVRQALATLPALDRLVIEQRFYRGRSQTQIAQDLQISQMQVSRIITRATAQLRGPLVDV
ncbi:MAG: sigma-70 family RNA polymerase sigma factor [Actinomycetota bacterium]|nr:sigma-70 family RNA polymerase sigma factor [Actinomycetota bacterium]MDP2288253.1 sigma-70 family RNA polymerase sigma factor [Actinomycetota bacterium]